MRLLLASVFCSLLVAALGSRPLQHGEELRLESGRGVKRGCIIKPSNGRLHFSHIDCESAVASGTYVPGQRTASGWSQLHVSTSGAFPDLEQMRAAGFLEAYFSAEQIWAHRHNFGQHFNLSVVTSEAPIQWLLQQHAWATEQAAANTDSAFWRGMALLLAQLDGLVAGYAEGVKHGQGQGVQLPKLGLADFLFLSAVGDLDDIIPAISRTPRVAWETLNPKQVATALGASGKCSALIKVADDLSDLHIAHSAWFTFSGLVRIYKHYDFQLSDPSVRLRSMSFSSYPGELASDDDFYLLDTGLVVLQTTNGIYNTSLYDLVKPQSALSWQRARIASFMGDTGESWVGFMDTHPSGTLNGQWMVVDLKRFTPGAELDPGLLWVLEQSPGLSAASDTTAILEFGHWPSYNVPYYPSIYKWSGYPQFLAAQSARGADYANAVSGASYQLAPRAKIYRRDVGEVANMATLKSFMRSNRWPNDPFDNGNPLHAICGRGDVDPENPVAYGCIDTKITNAAMARERRAYAVVGPTTGDNLPPFEWKGALAEQVAHIGQPDTFDYRFELMTSDDKHWGTPSLASQAAAWE